MALVSIEGSVFVNACTWCCYDLGGHGVCLCCGRTHPADRRASALLLRPNPSTINARGGPVVPIQVDYSAPRHRPSRELALSRP
jgi:hypothetical protein